MFTPEYTTLSRRRLGEALEAARTMIGLCQQEAADAIGVSLRRLRRWEQGSERPARHMATRIAEAYGLEADAQLPSRTPIVFDTDAGGVIVSGHTIPYIPGVTPNDDFLGRYTATVRDLRGIQPDTPIQLRSTDIDVLATLLDLRDEALEDRIASWTGQHPGSMAGVRHRLVLAAVTVGAAWGTALDHLRPRAEPVRG